LWWVGSSNASDFARLELNTNPFLEKQLQLLIDCVDDLQQESNKLQVRLDLTLAEPDSTRLDCLDDLQHESNQLGELTRLAAPRREALRHLPDLA
jgi:hypothetical protein